MASAFLVDGFARGQIVQISETAITYHTEKPKPLELIPFDPTDPLTTRSLFETVDYRIELVWLTSEEELRAIPVRVGWCERKPAAWELPHLIDPEYLWVIRQLADGAVPITAEQAAAAHEACKPPPPPDRHDHDWCRESDGSDACIDGAHYGMCGHPNCYGACEWFGDCPCKCHIPERVRTGRPIRLKTNNKTPGDGE